MMVNESDPSLIGNDRFEGFCIDLVNEIARLRNFSVEFDLVEGGSYGGIDPVTGKPSGMVKALLEQVRVRGHSGRVKGQELCSSGWR